MRKSLILVAAAVAAAVLLAILLPRVISLDSLKPRIVALLEEKTGRNVSFSKLSLTLLPGIGVKILDLTVSGDPGHAGENLLSVPEAEIRVAFLPLLAGRAEFGKLLLRRPEVLFRRYRDGTHSATQIAARMAPGEAPAGEGKAPARKERVSVALKELAIEQAKLTLFLEGDKGEQTRWNIDPLTLRLSGIGGTRNEFRIETRVDGAVRGDLGFAGSLSREGGPAAYRLDGKGNVFGQPITADGTVSASDGPAQFDLAVAFPRIDVAKIPGMFARPPEALAGVSLKGEGALTVRVSGNLGKLGVAADLRFPPVSATARGSLDPSAGSREWSASARIASLSDLAKNLGEGFSRWEPAGRLAVQARGKRASASAKESWSASVDLGDVAVRIADPAMRLEGLNGNVELSDRNVDFRPLAGSLNGQRFTLRGPVSLGAAPAGPMSLRMSYLDLDALFPPETGKAPEAGKEPSAPGGTKEEPKRIAARGEVRIDAGKGRDLEFRELAGSGRYEGGTLFLDSLSLRLYGGSATVSGRIRLEGGARDFRVKTAVKDVAAGEILSRKTSLKDYFTGKATVSADLGGGAGDFAEFSRTASGAGSFRVTDGKIKGVDLLAAAADRSGLSSVLAPVTPSKKIGTRETSFSDLSADFRIEGGKVRTDSLRIVSDQMSLSGPAALGFDRTIEFRGTLALSRELSERARGIGGQYLTGGSGRVEVPLVISGNLASPDVAVDREALARGAAEKALERLKGRLPGMRSPAGEEEAKPPGRTEPGKALEGLFDKLLPRKK